MELSTPLNSSDGYRQLLQQISDTYTQGRVRAVQAVNSQLVETYWQVGRHIVEFEQAGQVRAEYGKALIDTLAADLGLRHGKGFSRSNLIRFRQFYLAYPDLATKGATLSHQLTWSHIVELLKIDDPLERGFYEQQALRERWSVREMVRQKDSALFLRLAASQDKAGILQLAQQGQVVEQPADLLREPYVFEFLKIPEPYQLSETQLETAVRSPAALSAGAGQGLHLRRPAIPRDHQRHAPPRRSGVLSPHPALLPAHRPEARRGAAPRHRADEPPPRLLRQRGERRG